MYERNETSPTVDVDTLKFIVVRWKLKIDEGRTMEYNIDIIEYLFNSFRITNIGHNGCYWLRFSMIFK